MALFFKNFIVKNSPQKTIPNINIQLCELLPQEDRVAIVLGRQEKTVGTPETLTCSLVILNALPLPQSRPILNFNATV